MRHGFTIIECAIVLAIVALFVGGVLVGRGMMDAAQLNRVYTDVKNYEKAYHTFRVRYGHLPGDFPKARSIWGDNYSINRSGCRSTEYADGTPGTCDGDGNGFVNNDNTGGDHEAEHVWEQLALAGMIKGSYVAETASFFPIGIRGGRIYFDCAGPSSLMGPENCYHSNWHGKYGNFTTIGLAGSISGYPMGVMNATDASHLDSKYDDGLPHSGMMMAQRVTAGWCNPVGDPKCQSCTSGSAYNLTGPQGENSCKLIFPFK